MMNRVAALLLQARGTGTFTLDHFFSVTVNLIFFSSWPSHDQYWFVTCGRQGSGGTLGASPGFLCGCGSSRRQTSTQLSLLCDVLSVIIILWLGCFVTWMRFPLFKKLIFYVDQGAIPVVSTTAAWRQQT